MGVKNLETLRAFFNNHHDKLLCTANALGEPDIALMGTPRLTEQGAVEFEISDRISVTLENIKQNKAVVFMAYVPGERARDFKGARIYADVTDLVLDGEKFEDIKARIRDKFGQDKADELQATASCTITRVRPVVDRGQDSWDAPPYAHD